MSDEARGRPSPAVASRRSTRRWTAVSAVVLACAIVYTFWRPSLWTAHGPSMLPALTDGDRLLTLMLALRPGDVVVVLTDDDATVVKRVVGVAGDTIEMRAGRLFRNGHAVTGPTRPARGRDARGAVCAHESIGGVGWDVVQHEGTFSADTTHPVRVAVGQVFVLGDQRDRSNDSRYFGPVRIARVLGRVVLVVWRGRPTIRC